MGAKDGGFLNSNKNAFPTIITGDMKWGLGLLPSVAIKLEKKWNFRTPTTRIVAPLVERSTADAEC